MLKFITPHVPGYKCAPAHYAEMHRLVEAASLFRKRLLICTLLSKPAVNSTAYLKAM